MSMASRAVIAQVMVLQRGRRNRRFAVALRRLRFYLRHLILTGNSKSVFGTLAQTVTPSVGLTGPRQPVRSFLLHQLDYSPHH
jgi:hypothetical protein